MMLKIKRRLLSTKAFTITEILIAIIIIAISVAIFMLLQATAFSRTKTANRILDAGQIIEKRIEWKRMQISINPTINFPAVGTVETFTENGITVVCSTKTAFDPKGNPLTNVRLYKLVATWGSTKPGDTLQVNTYIAKDF